MENELETSGKFITVRSFVIYTNKLKKLLNLILCSYKFNIIFNASPILHALIVLKCKIIARILEFTLLVFYTRKESLIVRS